MTEILLIPGYATELSAPLRPARKSDGGFTALTPEVISGKAVVYRWGIRESFSFFELLNPFRLVSLYRRERRLAATDSTLLGMKRFLEEHVPKQVICHSMGCYLFAEYIKQFPLPTSVTSVIFVQADIAASEFVKMRVLFKNFYCPWDPTLVISALLHRAIPAGLVGFKEGKKSNELFSLWRLPNLHTSSIRDTRLKLLSTDLRI